MLRWWGGGGEDGKIKPPVPQIEGTSGKMSCAPKDKTQWITAVLDKAEPRNSYGPGHKAWARLRRTMPPAARALLQELEGAGDGAAEPV